MGEPGQGSDGLASLVQRTRASIGYVEYSYARPRRLAVAALRNRDGHDTKPGLDSFKAAVGAANWSDGDDLAPSLLDLEGPNCWPITSASQVLMRARADAPPRSRALLAFFDWALTMGGPMAEAQDYVPLPASALQRISATVEAAGPAPPRASALDRLCGARTARAIALHQPLAGV